MLCDLLPLNRWEINFDIMGDECEDRAFIDVFSKDKIARIEINKSVLGTDELMGVVLHELIHAIVAPLKDSALSLAETFVRKEPETPASFDLSYCVSDREEELVIDLTAFILPLINKALEK